MPRFRPNKRPQHWIAVGVVAFILFALVTLGLAVLYRYGPSKNELPWRWLTWGSVLAGLAWLGVSAAFSWYTANLGTYDKTYGSLGAVVGFMVWIWISAIVILLGQVLNETVPPRVEGQAPKTNVPRSDA